MVHLWHHFLSATLTARPCQRGCFSLDLRRKRPWGSPIANVQLTSSMNEGEKKIFSVESQRNLGLGCHCNIVWRNLANRTCEPISANEREQIPGPVGLLINKSLLYSVLGGVQLESWTQSQTRKVGPREGPEPRFIWNQFYFPLMMAYRNHFLFNPGWVGFSFTCNWEVAY